MLMRPPRVAAIHDLSGFGRCSLTVILPALSVMGIQVVPLTTALLSTHTGGFSNVIMEDLTGYIPKAVEQYRSQGIEFECVYTGFLSSEQQFDDCLEVLDAYPNAMAVVDPVMGDHGRIYKTYTREMCRRVGELVHRADLITPNPTEVALLLREDPVMLPLTAQQYKTKLLRLSELGPKQVIVTGAQLADHTMNNIGYDRDTGSFWRVRYENVPVGYPGTGDLFASVVVGALLKGDSLPIAMERATRFLELTIKTTFSYSSDPRFGVMLENTLPWLSEKQILDGYEML